MPNPGLIIINNTHLQGWAPYHGLPPEALTALWRRWGVIRIPYHSAVTRCVPGTALNASHVISGEPQHPNELYLRFSSKRLREASEPWTVGAWIWKYATWPQRTVLSSRHRWCRCDSNGRSHLRRVRVPGRGQWAQFFIGRGWIEI